ncbi:hypothetical protein AX15_006024 [Amanita polypyramis BW_CC]|nr:hypothetical protein AX15_006024 [Amanita polypyramis BW_CC]
MKESYGRRREVALRIKLINREESLMESLRRWVLRAQENLGKPQDASPQESLTRMVNEAKGILSHSDSPVDGSPSGSLARIISAQMSAGSLVKELHTETARRLELQTALAVGQQNQDPSGINKDSCQENGTQYEVSSSSVAIQASLLPSDEPTVVSPLVINIPSIGPILSFDHPNAIKEQLYTDHIPNGDDVLRTSLKGGINTSEAVPGEDDTRPATTAETGPEEGQVEGHKLVKDKHPVDAIDHTELEIPGAMVAQGRDVAAQTSVPEIVVGHAEEVPQSLLLSVDDGPPAARSEEPYTDINTVNSNPSVIRNESMQQLTLDLQPRPQHPLLTDLTKVNHRYDELQRAFHDCHFALDALKQSLTTTPLNNRIPPDALKLALERLNDYIEDARVELEIRIADESLLARGYETLLSVPGALTSPDPRSIGGGAEDPTPSRSEIEEQIEAFVSGIEPGVQKAQENLTRKLSDVQHDIAILKRAIHDQEGEASTVLSEGFIPSSPTPGPVPATAPVVGSRNGGWASWIHSPSSRPSSPAPTFGNIMTSPRLRHSPSLNLPGIARPGKPYVLSNTEASKDPLASLGLRVPMPMFMPSQATLHPTPRSRTVPTMYMIGLGARTTSGSLTSLLSPQRTAELPKEDDGVGDVE